MLCQSEEYEQEAMSSNIMDILCASEVYFKQIYHVLEGYLWKIYAKRDNNFSQSKIWSKNRYFSYIPLPT